MCGSGEWFWKLNLDPTGGEKGIGMAGVLVGILKSGCVGREGGAVLKSASQAATRASYLVWTGPEAVITRRWVAAAAAQN